MINLKCALTAWGLGFVVIMAPYQSALSQSAGGAYPSRPVKLIVPLAPGAGVDIETRMYAQKLSEHFRSQFLVDYKPGASGVIGSSFVAKAPADGYTLLSTSSQYATVAALHTALPFDPVKDLAPVSLMSKIAYPLIVHPSVPVKNIQEYLRFAKSKPGGVNFGTAGLGGLPHVMGESLHRATNTKATFVHYQGGAPAFAAVLAGEVDVVWGGFAAMNPHIRSGKVRMIGVSTAQRSKLYPDMPSIAEQGVKGYDVSTWIGILAPGKTAPGIINRLNSELRKVAADPQIIQRVEREGGTMVGSTSEEFKIEMNTEIERWKKIGQQAGIQLGK